MSKYRIVKADFKTPDSLIRALNDLKVEYQRGADLRRNEATLRTNWSGFYGGKSAGRCSHRPRRACQIYRQSPDGRLRLCLERLRL
jgi:hypothetical protein